MVEEIKNIEDLTNYIAYINFKKDLLLLLNKRLFFIRNNYVNKTDAEKNEVEIQQKKTILEITTLQHKIKYAQQTIVAYYQHFCNYHNTF